MPAKSKAQRRMMALVEHHPEMLYKKNKSAMNRFFGFSMSKEEMHKYAATKEKGLPAKLAKRKVK